jgi:hypothetical protein
MTYRVVYASNGASIGDGTRIARISEDGTKLEIMTDTKTGRFVEVVLKSEGRDFSADFSSDFA